MRQFSLILAVSIVALAVVPLTTVAEEIPESFVVHPIGRFQRTDESTRIVLDKKYQAGLLGLDGYSHIQVFWWFSNNDTPQKRSVLQVHPRGNGDNPPTDLGKSVEADHRTHSAPRQIH